MSDRVPSDCPLSSWMLRNIHEQKGRGGGGSPCLCSKYGELKTMHFLEALITKTKNNKRSYISES